VLGGGSECSSAKLARKYRKGQNPLRSFYSGQYLAKPTLLHSNLTVVHVIRNVNESFEGELMCLSLKRSN